MVTTTGHMFESGRLPGFSEFGRSGNGSNHRMPLFIRIPVVGNTTLLPKEDSKVCVRLTMLPLPSMTVRWVVQVGSALSSGSPMVSKRAA